MEISLKTKNRLTIWTSISGYILKRIKHNKSNKYLHTHVYSIAVHNSQNLKSTEISSSDEWIKNGGIYSISDYKKSKF